MKLLRILPCLLMGILSLLEGTAAAQTPNKPATAPSLAGVQAKTADEPNAIRVLLAPALETTLVSQMAGRIAAINVTFGDRFAKGKTLLSFDSNEQVARVKMAEAELASARENHEAKLRMQGLQLASEVEVSLAASAVAKSRAQVDLYRAQLAQCTVAAPFAGRVVKIAVKPYQSVNQAQPLLEIVSSGPLKLRLNVPAKWVGWLKNGTPFEVAIDETGKRYKATISALNGRIDAISQTIELEATIADKADELLPGMSGTARFNPPS